MNGYHPSGPYEFKSGKREGKPIELLMFEDHGFLRWLLRKMNQESRGNKNLLHRHLEWLMEQGENRQPSLTCPYCGKRKVKFLSIRWSHVGRGVYDFSAGASFTCCDNQECMERVRALAAGKEPEFLPIRFSILDNFRSKGDKKRIATILKQVFGLPSPLRREAAFNFFNAA